MTKKKLCSARGHSFFVKRTLYYWAKKYDSQLVRGMGYSELRSIYAILQCLKITKIFIVLFICMKTVHYQG
ncbi:PD-(D/E)XK nuclease family transposase [Lysinibacillus sp. JNUCC 51]|nr:PD-(D/E)XK nuclease family transposase [Lysinibacillus sp. JNUCC-51]